MHVQQTEPYRHLQQTVPNNRAVHPEYNNRRDNNISQNFLLKNNPSLF
jgi:hypothetical protein